MRKPKTDKDKESDGEKPAAPKRFFYMVRLPRPEPNVVADSETVGLEASAQLKLERLEYLNAALRVKQVAPHDRVQIPRSTGLNAGRRRRASSRIEGRVGVRGRQSCIRRRWRSAHNQSAQSLAPNRRLWHPCWGPREAFPRHRIKVGWGCRGRHAPPRRRRCAPLDYLTPRVPRPQASEGGLLAAVEAGATAHQRERTVVRASHAWGAELGGPGNARFAWWRARCVGASGVAVGHVRAWCLTRRMRCTRVRVGARSQVSKSNAQTLTNAALDGLKAASSEIRAKIEVLKPLQERLSSTQKEVRSRAAHPPPWSMPSWQMPVGLGGRVWLAPSLHEGGWAVDSPTPSGCGALRLTGACRKRLQEGEVRALEKELPVTSEQALNDTVKQIEYRISHEQVPLAEEKLLVRVHCVAVERLGSSSWWCTALPSCHHWRPHRPRRRMHGMSLSACLCCACAGAAHQAAGAVARRGGGADGAARGGGGGARGQGRAACGAQGDEGGGGSAAPAGARRNTSFVLCGTLPKKEFVFFAPKSPRIHVSKSGTNPCIRRRPGGPS